MEIIDKYETFIFDLDDTIWVGSKEKFWARCLNDYIIKPTSNGTVDIIYDSDNEYIMLNKDITDFLIHLTAFKKNIGFITRGGVKHVDFDNQPAVVCLKLFKILKYFNHQTTVLYRDQKKSDFIKPKGKTLFIDDDPEQLLDIKTNTHGSCDTLNRTKFAKWNDLNLKNSLSLVD